MKLSKVFDSVGLNKPRYSEFDLSHSNLFDCDFGEIIPADVIDCVPGDRMRIDLSIVGRLTSSLQSPILQEMDIVSEAFFVPYRLLMGSQSSFDVLDDESNFDEFLSGGEQGSLTSLKLPQLYGTDSDLVDSFEIPKGGVSDYIGIEPHVYLTRGDYSYAISALAHRAYRFIWNEFYRDENLMDRIQEVQKTDDSFIEFSVYDSLLRRCWRKDYFTSSLPWQQRGTAPALPVSGILPVENQQTYGPNFKFKAEDSSIASGIIHSNKYGYFFTNPYMGSGEYTQVPTSYRIIDGISSQPVRFAKVGGSVDLSNAVTFDVNDLRYAFQVQRWLERNARGGVRYTEFLEAHFGVSPKDARLQRPEFLGAFKQPWIISEVLQTSSSLNSTPQGTQSGQAISINSSNILDYRCEEYGLIMILVSVVPKASYQNGIPKQFTKSGRFDFYFPEFAHLSEQAILKRELKVSGDSTDLEIFGFTGIYNEMRYLPNRVSNNMRSGNNSFDYWHLGRNFSNAPSLNKDFLLIGGTPSSKAALRRIFAVQNINPFILHVGFSIKAIRPLPYEATPGYIDHF